MQFGRKRCGSPDSGAILNTLMDSPDLLIREVTPEDAPAVAGLSGRVIGWIEVAATHHLAADPRAEIAGLVVSAEARSRGIGR